MNCIDDVIIQSYIDGETDIRETEQIETHIAECSLCSNRIEEKRAFANIIKADLQKLNSPSVEVPCWAVVQPNEIEEIGSKAVIARAKPEAIHNRLLRLRLAMTNKSKNVFNIKHMVYIASAACVALVMLFVLLPEKHKDDENNFLLMYSVITDFDANRTFSQQEKSIFIIDSDGKIIEL